MNTIARDGLFATIIALLMTTVGCGAHAQVPAEVSATEFFAGKVNGTVDLHEFVTAAADWDVLKDGMGQPVTESCDTTFYSVECTLSWDGVSAYYMDYPDKMNLVTLEFDGPGAFLGYGSASIRVGDPIGQLANIFPTAYEQRGDNCSTQVEEESVHQCSHAAIVKAPDDLNSMTFTYDPGSLLIEKIEFTRNIF